MADKRLALIVGASRGLGLGLAEELCAQGWDVIGTVRHASTSLEDVQVRYPDQLRVEEVDIADTYSVERLRQRLRDMSFSLLFVVAGITRAQDRTALDVDQEEFLDLMVVNALGPMRVIEALEGSVLVNGVIAAMTSGLASISRTTGYTPCYSASKAALNMLFSAFSAKRPQDSRAMLLITPGWVRTDMGGDEADLSIEESVRPIVQTVDEHFAKPGLRFIDRFGQTLPW